MAKIDIDKFIIALFESDRFNYQDKHIVRELLEEQGLRIKDGEIVSIEPEPFKLKEGVHYLCIKDWKYCQGLWHKGGVYKTIMNDLTHIVGIEADNGCTFPFYDKEVFETYFRPATERERIIASEGDDVPETDFGNKSDDLSDFKKCLVEFYNNARDLITDKDGIKNRIDAYSMLNDYQCRLMAIARKELESEGRIGITLAEFEIELEHLYKYADEVQYNRGHVDGWDESRKALVDEIDIDAMVDEFNSQLHEWGGATPYRQGIEDVLKKIKSE